MIPTQYVLLASSLLATLLSTLISVIPIGIYDQGQVSALYPTLITPATYTFGIWSIIYLSWIIVGIFIAVKNIKIAPKNTYLLAAAQILSSFWLIPSQFLYIGLSLCVMLGVLYLLALGFFLSRKEEKYFTWVFDLFLGWIIVATIANIHITLVSWNIYIFPVYLTLISLILGTLLVLFLFKKYNSFIPALVFLWALIGIISAQDISITQQVSGLSALTILATLGFSYKDTFIKSYKKLIKNDTKK